MTLFSMLIGLRFFLRIEPGSPLDYLTFCLFILNRGILTNMILFCLASHISFKRENIVKVNGFFSICPVQLVEEILRRMHNFSFCHPA